MTAMGFNAVEAGSSMIHWCAVVMLREGKCMHIPQVSEGNTHTNINIHCCYNSDFFAQQ